MAITKAASAATGFFAAIDAPIPDTGGAKAPEASPSEDIVFKDVTFAYPSRPNVKVFDNLNVRLEKGKVTAIVGPSGSGKSTIVALLERWYQLLSRIRRPRQLIQTKLKKVETLKRWITVGLSTWGLMSSYSLT